MNQQRSSGGSQENTASAAWTPQEVVKRFGLQPTGGRLVPLKTRGEIRASNETIDVYVVEIPAKSASAVLSSSKTAIKDLSATDLQHLRRVIKPEFLPQHLQSTFAQSTGPTETRILLISATFQIPLADLTATLSGHPPFLDSAFPLNIQTIPVPALAPISAQQADCWSKTFWPTAYKHTNPFGPHPSLMSRAQAEIEPTAGVWLSLADTVAEGAASRGMGERTGCVIMERRTKADGGERVVAAAGDGRWIGLEDGDKKGPGNVMAHAVLRAIGMIARKRLRIAEAQRKEEGLEVEAPKTPYRFDGEGLYDPTSNDVHFSDGPGTDIEDAIFGANNLTPNGYLCVDLEIYLTHEPCVMCAMAILHSRFGRVVFKQRRPSTGGLTAEEEKSSIDDMDATDRVEDQREENPTQGLGYGLFWRPTELNWKMLAWEWRAGYIDDSLSEQSNRDLHI